MKHRRFIIIFAAILLFLSGLTIHAEGRPKLVILVVNHVSWDDLYQARAPFLQTMIRNGAVGLLNTKTLSGFNPSGSFLTIGMSNRTKITENVGIAFDAEESVLGLPGLTGGRFLSPNHQAAPKAGIFVPKVNELRALVQSADPGSNPGMLGQIFKDNGKRVALFGNADIPGQMHREAALMVMDTTGWIPLGTVSDQILQTDPALPLGYRTNYEVLFQKMKALAGTADVIAVETGDTSRLEYWMKSWEPADPEASAARRRLIETMDPFLGGILTEMHPENILLFGATPNREMIQKGNTGLTPILLYGKGRGYLTSASTRRRGYVTNLDLASTICNLTGIHQSGLGKGLMMQVNAPAQAVSRTQAPKLIQEANFFQNLRKVRYPVNAGITALYFIGILVGFLMIRRSPSLQITLMHKVSLIALLLLPLGVLTGGITGYSMIWLPLAVILTVTVISALVLVKLLPFRLALTVTLLLVPFILLGDVFTGGQFMLRSVMGSDLIAGGRFYGIGNDLMGVIIGTLAVGIGLALQEFPLLRRTAGWWATLLFLIAAVGIGVPRFGANVGGMITALMTGMTAFMILREIPITWRTMVFGFMAVIGLVVLIACGDAFLNPRPTHAGRTILALIDQGSGGFFQIIKVKVSILGGAIVGSWWSLLFWIELLLWPWVKTHFPDFLPRLQREYPFWWTMMKSLGIGCLTALVFNDTGIIAAALILAYFWLTSLGLYLYHAPDENQPFRSRRSGEVPQERKPVSFFES